MRTTNLSSKERMHRIRRVSFTFRILCVIAFVLVLLFAINLAWYATQESPTVAPAQAVVELGESKPRITGITTFSLGRGNFFMQVPGNPTATLLSGWAGLAFTAVGIGLLYRLFRQYERGLIFEDETVRLYRWIALWLLAGWVLSNTLQFLRLLAPQGEPVAMHFSIDELFFGGVLLLLVSWIMEEGAKLQEEQALTV